MARRGTEPQSRSCGKPLRATALDTGCLAPPATPDNPTGEQFPSGIEAYGTGHYFYNNEVENNSGMGMQFAGSDTTGDITISSWNPWVVGDVARYVEYNGFNGIMFLGSYTLQSNG